jgi:hypothetical protein
MVKPVLKRVPTEEEWTALDEATHGFYSASFASMRSELKARAKGNRMSIEDVTAVIADHLSPDIGATRRYQMLQALINCTRRSLLPDPRATDEERSKWVREARALESMGGM